MQVKVRTARQQKKKVLQVYKIGNILKNIQRVQNLHFCKPCPTTLPVLNSDVSSFHNTFLEKVLVAVTF